jgi:hypothetical protein
MSRERRLFTCMTGLMLGCGLMLGLAGGQDGPGGGKGKKDKGPKGDPGDPEAKAIYKTAEKAAKGPESERDKWLKEMNKVYPGRVSPGLSAGDFAQWFDLLAGGRAEWRRDDVAVKQIGELHDRAAERLGLGPVPFLRREDLVGYAMRFLEPGNSPPWKTVDPRAEADKVFDKLDRDGSGFLEPGEWTDRLRADARRVDRNRDGRIDRDEYRAYFEGRVIDVIEFGPDPPPLPAPVSRPRPPDEPLPYAIRYGKMPPGIPPWFVELDTDRDGQVALYEWRRAGLPMAQFQEMDLNEDGLLPPDEYLRYVRLYRPEGFTVVLPTASAPPNANRLGPTGK